MKLPYKNKKIHMFTPLFFMALKTMFCRKNLMLREKSLFAELWQDIQPELLTSMQH